MDDAALNAITDPAALRALVRETMAKIAQHATTIAKHQQEAVYKDAKIEKLTRELARLRRLQYARTAESIPPEQAALFDEAIAEDIGAVEAELDALRTHTPLATPRKKPVRRPLPPELRREVTVHEPAACQCEACGRALAQIGVHVSEKLDIVPAEFFVRRDEYPQYACRHCERIVSEPVAPTIIDRGEVAPGLLAHLAIQKYADHLPLYRQEAIFARHGIALARSTLAEWIGHTGVALQPLVDALRAKLLAAPVLHADETPVRQLAPGTGGTRRAYLFAYRSPGPRPIVIFDYCATRAGKHAADFLDAWQGALMVDDYGGYKALFRNGVTELGCWAHARRKFFDAHADAGSPAAKQALEHIGALYAIEAELRNASPKVRGEQRQHLLRPRMDAFKQWLIALKPELMGNTGLARAVNYTLKRWDALACVADDGGYPFDNNPAENAIRPIAIGRKNWLFTGSHTAGQRAAAIMSLIATAKANGIEPHAWLTDVLTRLPTCKDIHIDTLLPLEGYQTLT